MNCPTGLLRNRNATYRAMREELMGPALCMNPPMGTAHVARFRRASAGHERAAKILTRLRDSDFRRATGAVARGEVV